MFALSVAVLCSLWHTTNGHHKFPPGFKFGVATSSYQIEGAWNASDRGESNWDRMIHTDPDSIVNRSNADVAANSYHLWREDIHVAKELGLDFYRFSVSWTRILPTGFPNKVNKHGVHYYNKLIDGLLQRGIEPVVTMFHHEIPQTLADLGGWTNPLMADWFADFASILYTLFADRVKTWITINEPLMICDFTYNLAIFPPRVLDTEVAPYVCSKTVLLAHAKAWRIYDEDYREKYHGRVAMANNPLWVYPLTPDDEHLAVLTRELGGDRFSHPIFSEQGGWPPSVEKLMAEYSKKQGYSQSVLPAFTEEEIEMIKGTYDFYGLNYYTCLMARSAKVGEVPGPWFIMGSKVLNAVFQIDPKWQTSNVYGCGVVPQGLRSQIGWVTERYGNVSIFITENGFATSEDDLHDESRLRFIKSHLEQVLLSIEDGANVEAYTVWSLIDNFEWSVGYVAKFGLYHVDFSNPKRPRTARLSARYYKHVIAHRSVKPAFLHENPVKIRNHTSRNNIHYIIYLLSLIWIVVK